MHWMLTTCNGCSSLGQGETQANKMVCASISQVCFNSGVSSLYSIEGPSQSLSLCSVTTLFNSYTHAHTHTLPRPHTISCTLLYTVCVFLTFCPSPQYFHVTSSFCSFRFAGLKAGIRALTALIDRETTHLASFQTHFTTLCYQSSHPPLCLPLSDNHR